MWGRRRDISRAVLRDFRRIGDELVGTLAAARRAGDALAQQILLADHARLLRHEVAEAVAEIAARELELVMRLARAKGCHAGMQHLSAELSYAEPVPVEPKDEADEKEQLADDFRRMEQAMSSSG